MPAHWTRQISTLRQFRVWKPRDVSMTPALDALEKELKKRRRNVEGIAWDEVAPPQLAARSGVEKLTPGGILTIRCDDAAARFEIDRWLRAGGDAELRKQSRAGIRRIKLT